MKALSGKRSGGIKRGSGQPLLSHRLLGRSGFGLNEVIGIAAGIIIAVVVVIPGLRTFATNLIESMSTWWDSLIGDLFISP